MAKLVMLAVAGAGKTYHICHEIDKDRKNLILAYTHQNIRNINRELIKAYDCVPDLTSVMTFYSFVYRFLICPYEPSILQYFQKEGFVRKGITTKEPPLMQIPYITKWGTKGMRPNPCYHRKDTFEHYIWKDQYYCKNMSELLMHVKDKDSKERLITRVATALNKFYDQIMIDEFQDFREFNYDLIVELARHVDNITLAGDYYQHSVSAVNNSGRPFTKRRRMAEQSGAKKCEVSYDEFKEDLRKYFQIDETTLAFSRRCTPQVCRFVESNLGIKMQSCKKTSSEIIWVDENTIDLIFMDSSIMKLVYNEPEKYTFNCMNWSYSKGDTFDSVCVILTSKFDGIGRDKFVCPKDAPTTVNKLYVAITRTSGNLYLVPYSIFKMDNSFMS